MLSWILIVKHQFADRLVTLLGHILKIYGFGLACCLRCLVKINLSDINNLLSKCCMPCVFLYHCPLYLGKKLYPLIQKTLGKKTRISKCHFFLYIFSRTFITYIYIKFEKIMKEKIFNSDLP
jgi:hypothetical protein